MKYNVTEQKYKWCGGSTSSYRNWCTGEPLLDIASNKICVAMKVNRVSDKSIGRGCLKVFDCKTALPYICHRRCKNYAFMESAVEAIDNILQV